MTYITHVCGTKGQVRRSDHEQVAFGELEHAGAGTKNISAQSRNWTRGSLSEILCERSHTIKFIPGNDTYAELKDMAFSQLRS